MSTKRVSIVTLITLLAIVPLTAAATNQPFANRVFVSQQSGSDTQVLLEATSPNWWSTVQEEIRQLEYQVTWQDDTRLPGATAAYQASNRAQNFHTYFTHAGPVVFSQDQVLPNWEWGISLARYGYDGDVQPVSPAELVNDGNRIQYFREGITEWYVNTDRGLEQGFTINSPPSRSIALDDSGDNSELVLEMELSKGLTPTLVDDGRTVEFTNAEGLLVLSYTDLYANDASGRKLPASLALSASVVSISIDDRFADYPIMIDPLVVTPSWTVTGGIANAELGRDLGTAGDVNGDGYDDIIIGAPGAKTAFVYHGSATGPSTVADWTIVSVAGQFGRSVGTAGDVNGDGYDDVIVGAKNTVYVYHGSANGLSPIANWIATDDGFTSSFGNSVGTAGDVNGDGYDDVIVGDADVDVNIGRASVYYGSANGLSTTRDWTIRGNVSGDHLGKVVATAGDVNGDGYDDVLVVQQSDFVFLFLGSAAGLSVTADWIADEFLPGDEFGSDAGTAGDVNGDGYDDIIIGAAHFSSGQHWEGVAIVYYGSAIGPGDAFDWKVEGNIDELNLGRSVGTAGDVNNDGYHDILVGSQGKAFVFLGSPEGPAGAADWTVASNEGTFGVSSGTAGDVNGDGYDDVTIGAFFNDFPRLNAGAAFLYFALPPGNADCGVSANDEGHVGSLSLRFELSTNVPATWNVWATRSRFSIRLEQMLISDTNTPLEFSIPMSEQSLAGKTFGTLTTLTTPEHGILCSDWLTSPVAWMMEGDRENAEFGSSVGTAGDVNGDGFDDVIVGAPLSKNGQKNQGAAFVFYGSARGLSTVSSWMVEGDQEDAFFGKSVGTAGDVNGDGFDDIIVGAPGTIDGQSAEGQVFVYYGSPTGLSATADWEAKIGKPKARFGISVGTAGDVNGDGYDDVIIGADRYSNDQSREGAAFVYFGSATGLRTVIDWMAESNRSDAFFGSSVGTAGDVNGDGYDDVVIGARCFDDDIDSWPCDGFNFPIKSEGRAFVYHGSAAGPSNIADWIGDINQEYAFFGSSVGTAGDVNGDGYDDVIIGANGLFGGRSYVYYGSDQGLSLTYDWLYSGGEATELWGGMAGDLDSDGYDDVIIAKVGKFKALVFQGSATGLRAQPGWTSNKDTAYAAGAAGDINGDGYDDVITGLGWFSGDEAREGAAFVFLGPLGSDSCALDVSLDYDNGDLHVRFDIGSPTPAFWNIWVVIQNRAVRIRSIPLPAIDPANFISATIPQFPQVGGFGILSTMTTPNKGVRCSDWQVVDTGSTSRIAISDAIQRLIDGLPTYSYLGR